MKQQKKNIEASRDTAPVVRSGTRVLPSREASLFQKMKKTITTKIKRVGKKEIKVPLQISTDPNVIARLKRAAKLEGDSVAGIISEAIKSFLEMYEERMKLGQEGQVIAYLPLSIFDNSEPIPLKKPYPPIAA